MSAKETEQPNTVLLKSTRVKGPMIKWAVYYYCYYESCVFITLIYGVTLQVWRAGPKDMSSAICEIS